MSLTRFNIIVAVDKNGGISKNGEIPWNYPEDMRFFRSATMGQGKNVVIMGRKTYMSIPEEFRPLKNRHCVIISNTLKQEEHPQISIYKTLLEALKGVGSQKKSYDEVFIAGGEVVYNQVLKHYLYLCDKIFVTKLKSIYECDQFFNMNQVEKFDLFSDPIKSKDFTRYVYIPKVKHDEYQYLDLLCKTLEFGERKSDRTGYGTLSLFGERMVFDIRNTIPVLTTKKVWIRAVIEELLFFISGKSDTKLLEAKGIDIWKGNTRSDKLRELGLNYEEGDMGPGYSHQLRHCGAEYRGANEDYTGQGFDQLQYVINTIKTDPNSRRIIINYWNPCQLDQMALTPCHILVQFNTCLTSDDGEKWLDCSVYQRSMDSFLGCPFNIASYSILTYMVGFLTGYKPRKLVYNVGDFHIYTNHVEQVKKQIKRMPRPFPSLTFRRQDEIKSIDDFKGDDFIIENYEPCSGIKAEMNA